MVFNDYDATAAEPENISPWEGDSREIHENFWVNAYGIKTCVFVSNKGPGLPEYSHAEYFNAKLIFLRPSAMCSLTNIASTYNTYMACVFANRPTNTYIL